MDASHDDYGPARPTLSDLFQKTGGTEFRDRVFQNAAIVDDFSAGLLDSLPGIDAFLAATAREDAGEYLEFIGPDGQAKLNPANIDVSADALRTGSEKGDVSIILREAERFLNLEDICLAIEDGFEGRASVTAFLCGAGAASSALHYDAVDVFALTVAGRKDWVIYEPFLTRPSKLAENRRRPICGAMMLSSRRKSRSGSGTNDVRAPRCVPHLVANPYDAPCLHFTISIAHDSYEDIYRSMMRKAMDLAFLDGRFGYRLHKDATNGQHVDTQVMQEISQRVADTMGDLMAAGQLSQHMQLSHHDVQTKRRIAERINANTGITATSRVELAPDNGGLLTEWILPLNICIFIEKKSRRLHLPLDRWKWIVAQQQFDISSYFDVFGPEATKDIEGLASPGVLSVVTTKG